MVRCAVVKSISSQAKHDGDRWHFQQFFTDLLTSCTTSSFLALMWQSQPISNQKHYNSWVIKGNYLTLEICKCYVQILILANELKDRNWQTYITITFTTWIKIFCSLSAKQLELMDIILLWVFSLEMLCQAKDTSRGVAWTGVSLRYCMWLKKQHYRHSTIHLHPRASHTGPIMHIHTLVGDLLCTVIVHSKQGNLILPL